MLELVVGWLRDGPQLNQHIDLASFQTSSGSDSGAQFLCPVHALGCFVETNAQFRQSDQLFVCYGGVKKAVSVSREDV